MFRIGLELQDVPEGRMPGSVQTVKVGVAMVVSKLLAYRILRPVIAMQDEARLICLEALLVDLLADLCVHKHPAVSAISQAARNKRFA